MSIAKLAKANGLNIIWHSNGSINPEPLKKLLKYTDAVTIDLKGFSQKSYDNSAAILEPTLKTLKIINESSAWLEIVNLIIPTINDDLNEIREMSKWIADNLGSDVPLHFSRFHPSYKLTRLSPTPIKRLEQAYKIGREKGINFITIGNVPGHKNNSTFCHQCNELLINRRHFEIRENNIIDGNCKFCETSIPGVWN